MKALLNPKFQPDLGLVILTPGKNNLHLFRERLLVATEPAELRKLPAGFIPVQDQLLGSDPRLLPFFQNVRVTAAAGGRRSLLEWVDTLDHCQWKDSEHDERNLTVHEYDTGGVCLCWEHAHKYRDQAHPELDRLAAANRAEWIVTVARRDLMLPEDHQLSLPELCWWCCLRGIVDAMPDEIARYVLRLPPAQQITGTMKESDFVIEADAVDILKEKGEKVKAVVTLDIDPDTPESFMLRPKRRRWVYEKYTQWVKRQPCEGCGGTAEDPHHIIGNGLGGTGTKAHDLFAIPLCRRCHDDLHENTQAWEEKHGTQEYLVLKTQDRALGMGVIAISKK
jgi:hypothetical protein